MVINRTQRWHIHRIAFGILVIAIIMAAYAWAQPASLTIQRVWTEDASGNSKTTFAPGDTIVFKAELNNPYGGMLLGTNGAKLGITTNPNFFSDTADTFPPGKPTDIPAGVSTWTWKATAPAGLGEYTATVKAYDQASGTIPEGSAKFTVGPAAVTPTPTVSVTPISGPTPAASQTQPSENCAAVEGTNCVLSTPTPTPIPPGSTLRKPVFVYPVDGQTIDYEGSYMFKVEPMAETKEFLWGFFQNGKMVWENYRDEKVLSGNEYAIHPDGAGHGKFVPGKVEVWVRALINGQWSEPTIITINLKPRSVTVTPTPTLTPTLTPTPAVTLTPIANETPINQSTVILIPPYGEVGDWAQGFGNKWPPNQSIDVFWDGESFASKGGVDNISASNVPINSNGDFLAYFKVPLNATPGNHTVTFVTKGAEPRISVNATFQVNATVSPTPTVSSTPAPGATPKFYCIIGPGGTPAPECATPSPTSTLTPANPPVVQMDGSGTAESLKTATGSNWIKNALITVKFDEEVIDTFTPVDSAWQLSIIVPTWATKGKHNFIFTQGVMSYAVPFEVTKEMKPVKPELFVDLEGYAYCTSSLIARCEAVQIEIGTSKRIFEFPRPTYEPPNEVYNPLGKFHHFIFREVIKGNNQQGTITIYSGSGITSTPQTISTTPTIPFTNTRQLGIFIRI